MISIDGLHALMERLSRLDLSTVQQESLASAAEQLSAQVQRVLSHRPGEDHGAPWLRTGMLRDSITHRSDGSSAAIGSNDPIAVYQELGTRSVPPRPFLGPTAASEGEGAAGSIAEAVVQALSSAIG